MDVDLCDNLGQTDTKAGVRTGPCPIEQANKRPGSRPKAPDCHVTCPIGQVSLPVRLFSRGGDRPNNWLLTRMRRCLVPPGPALRATDMVICPLSDGPKPHGGGPITPVASVPTVMIGGKPAAVANSIPGGIVCVSPVPNGIAVGSTTVLIGGSPAARMGDLTLHGVPVAPGPGCTTVLIGG